MTEKSANWDSILKEFNRKLAKSLTLDLGEFYSLIMDYHRKIPKKIQLSNYSLARSLSKNSSRVMISILQGVVANISRTVGNTPKSAAILLVGSVSRETACPLTDLDLLIVYEKEKEKDWADDFNRRIENRLSDYNNIDTISLDRKNLLDFLKKGPKRHLHIQTIGLDAVELFSTSPEYGKTLIKDIQDALTSKNVEYSKALISLADKCRQKRYDGEDAIELKNAILDPLEHYLRAMRLQYNIIAKHPTDILRQSISSNEKVKSLLKENFEDPLSIADAWNTVYLIRFANHLLMGRKNDFVRKIEDSTKLELENADATIARFLEIIIPIFNQ